MNVILCARRRAQLTAGAQHASLHSSWFLLSNESVSSAVIIMDIEVLESARGNPMFRARGFVYEVDNKCKKNENKFYCRCMRKKLNGCPARATIIKVRLSYIESLT